MNLLGKPKLIKLKAKNRGNSLLTKAIDDLVSLIEKKDWKSKEEIKADRPDADQVHNDGFFFFNIQVHRTLILIEFEEDGNATIVWAGTHTEYEATFKNNKTVIKKWLNTNGWI